MNREGFGFGENLFEQRRLILEREERVEGINGSRFGFMESNVGRERRFLGVVWRLNG